MKRNKFFPFNEPENAFIAIGIFFGILLLLITPPFQAPDEYNHFYRSFQIAEGRLIAEKKIGDCYHDPITIPTTTCAGGFLPKSIWTTAQKVSDVELRFNPEKKQKLQTVFSLLNFPLQSNDRIFINFQNTSVSYPIAYLPQAFGIKLGNIMGFSPLILMYMGRISNLFFWVFLGYTSIKIIPIFKWLIFLLELTPMSHFQASSLSPDAFTNGISILLIAILLNNAFVQEKPLNKVNILVILLLSFLLAFSKFAYFPIIILFLLIPIRKIRNRKKYFVILFLLILGCISSIIATSILVKELLVPYILKFDSSQLISSNDQLIYIFNHPLEFILVLGRTLYYQGPALVRQYIGVLGWLDTKLPIFLTISYLVMLMIVSLATNQKDIVISYKQKIIIFIIIIFNVTLVGTLLYLGSTPVGGSIIKGLQGRYFIPIAPLLFLLFYNQKFHFDMSQFSLVVVGYSLFSETITALVLLHRYWHS
jgi:uncharacterized membrane protein